MIFSPIHAISAVSGSSRRELTLTDDAAHLAHPAPEIDLGAASEPVVERAPIAPDDLAALIESRLDDDKAQEIVRIDLRDKSSVADAMIVASGRSHRHVGAMADHLLRTLKDAGLGKARGEGLPHCDWVLIDAGDVIVHLCRPEGRAFYNIEKIWSVDAPHRTHLTAAV